MGWVLDVVHLALARRVVAAALIWIASSTCLSFVESGYIVNDGPGYPRVKRMCSNVDGSGQCVLP